MNLLMKVGVLGIALMLSVWACANEKVNNNSARCDHDNNKKHVVFVTFDSDSTKPPSVNKENIVACVNDEIEFKAKGNADFSIQFRGSSPFEEGEDTSISSKPAAKTETETASVRRTVRVNPGICAEFFKYDVVDNANSKRPKLDPRIIIVPR